MPQNPQQAGEFFNENPDQVPVQEQAISDVKNQDTQVQWAGFFIRGVAFCIDLVVLDILFLILGFVGCSAMGISLKAMHLETPSGELVQFLLSLYLLVWILLFCTYFIFFMTFSGQTPAKMLMRIRVFTKDQQPLTLGRAVLRTLGYFISGSLLLGLGFLMVMFHPQKRALHDLVAGTVVIKLRSSEST
jgi:uncharacterized RDD family membrane protein YckC